MTTVSVKIKTFGDTKIPKYHSKLAAGFDLTNRETTTIKSHEIQMVGTGIAVEIPTDYWLILAARSSLHKLGLMLPHGIGVGDPDYCGDDDEYKILLYNFTDTDVTVEKDTRLAQAILVPRTTAEFTKVEHLGHSNRGGFGSTGQ